MSRASYRKTRSNEAAIWFKPVKEKKETLGRGRVAPGGLRLISVPQYKLFAFISKHFDGNVSRAAAWFGLKQVRLHNIVSKGVLKQSVIDGIVELCKELDPYVTEEALFIPPKFIKWIPKVTKKRPKSVDPGIPVIKPVIGHVVSVGISPFSAVLARLR